MYERLSYDERCVELSSIGKKNEIMDTDIHIYTLTDDKLDIYEEDKEVAILLFEGELSFTYDGKTESSYRKNVFEDMPFCLHVPKGTKVLCETKGKTQFLVQKAVNERHFEPVLYKKEDFVEQRAGDGFMDNTANRLIRTVFDYDIAPYSNMVLGEVISEQGRWSSYPPHHHEQPELYYYKFDKPQGFGCAMIEDEAHKVKDHSYIVIPGGLTHPQATAPGYRMYFCWIIRHLKDNPWNDRVYEKCHEWLLDA